MRMTCSGKTGMYLVNYARVRRKHWATRHFMPVFTPAAVAAVFVLL